MPPQQAMTRGARLAATDWRPRRARTVAFACENRAMFARHISLIVVGAPTVADAGQSGGKVVDVAAAERFTGFAGDDQIRRAPGHDR